MRKGFSLVELSVVLVILGLLVGGILAGKSLIRASELRTVTTEQQRYVTGAQAFRDKYFYWPGDMPNATAVWGVAAGVGTGVDAACRAVTQTGTATCNGDGDGVINESSYNDSMLFWKHLANAGLIEGTFSGAKPSVGGYSGLTVNMPYVQPGWNCPNSKLANAAWYVNNFSGWNAAVQKFYATDPTSYYINTLYLLPTNGVEVWNGGSLGTDEAWNIDTKMDDGRPGTGKIEVFRGGGGTPGSAGVCMTTADPSTAAYNLASSGNNLCALVFVRAFR